MRSDIILNYLKELKLDPNMRMFERIGLFGSYADNRSDEFSDIDIAVKVNKSYLESHDVWDYFDAMDSIKKGIMKRFNKQSDVFDIDSASPLRDKIIKDVIYV